MPILACLSLLYENQKKKKQWQNVTPSGKRTRATHSLWFQIQHYPFWTKLTFDCKTETLVSLYSYALLMPLKSSKSKCQVVHEQKFKDLLSSICQVSVERIVLDLELEAMRVTGSIPTGDFCHWISLCIHALKTKIQILAFLCVCEKPE